MFACLRTILRTIRLFPITQLLVLLITPFVTAILGNKVNKMLTNGTEDFITCLIFKTVLDYMTLVIQQDVFFKQAKVIYNMLMLRLNMAKIKCGVVIPGVNQKQHKDLITDSSKLRDFLSVLPMAWTTPVSFCMTTYSMKTHDIYPIRSLFLVFCIMTGAILAYLTDASVYEKSKPPSTSVIKFEDSRYARLKLSMGCHLDVNFEQEKQSKINRQVYIQKCAVIAVNFVTTYIALVTKNTWQMYSFSQISWMIGAFSDHIKSFNYYQYVDEFINMCECFEKHQLICNANSAPIDFINEVKFVDASFGYLSDLTKKPIADIKISKLNYTFYMGNVYYLEAPNGSGKSTIMKMFQSNLFSGEIYFGARNRKDLSFDQVMSSVYHIVQASEYTPEFSHKEIMAVRGRDVWLEQQLCLEHLFKDTVELSGGEKKRMFIYMALSSNAPILLLDETLGELSTENSPQVPEGGGWLTRVINTIINWPNRNKKLIILVGHGLKYLIQNHPTIQKLSMNDGRLV